MENTFVGVFTTQKSERVAVRGAVCALATLRMRETYNPQEKPAHEGVKESSKDTSTWSINCSQRNDGVYFRVLCC